MKTTISLEPTETLERADKVILRSKHLESLRLDARVELMDIIPPAEVCFSVKSYHKNNHVGTLGNFSAITGKAKSRKSFAACAIAACAIGRRSIISFETSLPFNQGKVLYVDTEQGTHHVRKCMKRIFNLTELAKDTFLSKIEFLALRKYTWKERLDIIEHTLIEYPELGLVVFDGIRDFIEDINNPGDAVMIVSRLMKWSEVYNIHILVVLHQNKTNSESRGHLGTEINNKAESIINVTKDTKDKSISIISSEIMRDQDFEPFAFSIDENGLPYLTEFSKSSKASPEEKKIKTLLRLATEIYYDDQKASYTSTAIQDIIMKIEGVAKRSAADRLKSLVEADFVEKEPGQFGEYKITKNAISMQENENKHK